MIPMALRNATYTSGIFGGYFITKHFTHQNNPPNFLENLLISSILNIPATILCSPFDVIRAKHTHHLLNNYNQHSLSHIIKEIWNNNGIKGFYKGYPSLYLNFAIRFPLTLALQFEIIKYL